MMLRRGGRVTREHVFAIGALVCGSSGFVQGCSSADAPSARPWADDDDVGQVRERSSSPATFSLWPNQVPIGICFVRGQPDPLKPYYLSNADFGKLKGWTLSVLGSSWGVVPGVSFVDAGSCTSQTMTVKLYDSRDPDPASVGTGGDCQYGVGATCRFGGNPSLSDPDYAFKRIVTHECGHALGMLHEHQRSDHGTLCSGVQAQLTACTNCKGGFDTAGVCHAPDWNGCVKPATPVTGDVFGSPGSGTYNQVMAPFNNNCTVGSPGCSATERLATTYDPVSPMNYCCEDNGGSATVLTDLDLLGLRILYPATPSQHQFSCVGGCFNLGTADAVVNSSGSVTSDWTAQGALSIVPTWHVGAWSGTSASLSAANIPAGTNTVTFNYTDWDSRAHAGSGSITNSDSLFAAISQTTTLSAWML